MADVYGVHSTDAFTGDPRDKAPVEFAEGRVRAVMDEYEASSLAADSAIRMGAMPGGSVLRPGQVDHDAMGAGVTLQVVLVPADGEGSNINLTSATAADSAGTINVNGIDDVLQRVLDKRYFVEVHTAGAAATGTIKLDLPYAARA